MANVSSNNENQYEKLIRLLEGQLVQMNQQNKEQLEYMNQQNKDLTKQIEALNEQVRHLTKLLYGSKNREIEI